MIANCPSCRNENAFDSRYCATCGNALAAVSHTQRIPSTDQNPSTSYPWMHDNPENRAPLTPPSTPHLEPEHQVTSSQLKQCPFCSEWIQQTAIKCRFCSEVVDITRRNFAVQSQYPIVNQNVNVHVPVNQNAAPYPTYRLWSPGLAAFLSFIIPGLGQIYKGQVGGGIVWFFVVIIGYGAFVIPGLILHLICIITAANGNPYQR